MPARTRIGSPAGSTVRLYICAPHLGQKPRVFSAPPVLLACGSDTIEVWQDVGTAPFPFQRVTVIPCGLIGTSAIAGGGRVWDRSVCFVAHDHTVRQLKGYDPVIVSNEDVSADIEECARSGLAAHFGALAQR